MFEFATRFLWVISRCNRRGWTLPARTRRKKFTARYYQGDRLRGILVSSGTGKRRDSGCATSCAELWANRLLAETINRAPGSARGLESSRIQRFCTRKGMGMKSGLICLKKSLYADNWFIRFRLHYEFCGRVCGHAAKDTRPDERRGTGCSEDVT